MQVILTKDVQKLGHKDDAVKVKDGFALNFLIPQGKAIPATPASLRQAESRRKERVMKVEEMLKNAAEIKEKLKGASLTFKRKAEGKKLFGSVTEKDILEAVEREFKVALGKEMVLMPEHLKTLGKHEVMVKLAPDMSVALKVTVEAE